MNQINAYAYSILTDELGHDPEDIHLDYSGRGMNGRTCLGYSGPAPALFVHDLAVALAADRDSVRPDAVSAWDVRELVEGLSLSERSDALGRGQVTYWLDTVSIIGT